MSLAQLAKVKVLLVDDDSVSLQIASAALEAEGYIVTCRQEGIGTTVIILRERPDVVLLDINMPALKGNEIARMLAGNKTLERTSFILFSALDATELERLRRECNALGAIKKDGDVRSFVEQFSRLVRSRRSTS